MKGFILEINKEHISGAINKGITSILITDKEGRIHIHFGSLDESGMISYTWYSDDLKIGDCLNISVEDIVDVFEAKEIRDYNMMTSEESQKMDLETYRRLRAELIEEGLISEQEYTTPGCYV